MALATRSLHWTPSTDGSLSGRYPTGNKPAGGSGNLSINRAAFAAANIRLTNLPAGTTQDFNTYRSFLTGTAAATATLSVFAATGTIPGWAVDASGNGIVTTGLVGSGALFVSANDNAGTIVNFDTQSWSVIPTSTLPAVKYHPGHYCYFDTTHWSVAQGRLITYANALKNNPNFKGFKINFFWSEAEGDTLGDYTKLATMVNTIRSIVQPIGKRYMLALWDRSFANSNGAQPSIIPLYARTANYAKVAANGTTFGGGGVGAIIDYSNPAVIARMLALHQAVGNLCNADPLFESYDPMGETAIGGASVAFGSNAPAVYNAAISQIFTGAKPFFQNTLLRLQANFAISSIEASIVGWYQLLRSLGGCCVGGPDPALPIPSPLAPLFSAQRVFAGQHPDGSASSNPDLRGVMPWFGEVQEDGLGSPRLAAGAPASISNFEVVAMKASHMIWDAQEFETVQFTRDIVPYVNSINGVTNSALPSEGNWNTT